MRLVLPLIALLLLAVPVCAQAKKPWLGITVEVLAKADAEKIGAAGGLKVTAVEEPSPAAEVGMKVGDIILSAGEDAVTSIEQMQKLMSDMRPGDFLSLGVRRANGRNEPLLITVGSRADQDNEYADDAKVKELRKQLRELDAERRRLTEELNERLRELGTGKANKTDEAKPAEPAKPEPSKPVQPERSELKVTMGISCRNLTQDEADKLGLKSGVLVTSVIQGGPGAEAEVRADDVITHVDGEAITGTGDLRTYLTQHNPGDRVELTLQRDGKELKVTILLRAR